MALKLITPPATEPLTLAETKAYLKLNDINDDTLISQMITVIRKSCEDWTGRALVTQAWTLWRDAFPQRQYNRIPHDGYFELPVDWADDPQHVIAIPRPPLQWVSFLKTYDTSNQATIFDAGQYLLDTASEPGRIVLNAHAAWPSGLRPANAVEIEFIAGYGEASAVPDALKQGMLLWIKLLYADRNWLFEQGESTAGLVEFNRSDVPPPVVSLWSPYKIYSLGRR